MVRTLISLTPEEKRWLDRKARRERVPMTRLVRRAVQEMMKRERESSASFDELLEATRGTWRGGDPLAYQMTVRDEWEDRSR